MQPMIAEGRQPTLPIARQCAIVVLAAGASRRLGRPKQMVRRGGESLVRCIARAALATRPLWVGVVVGAHASRVAAELRGLPVTIVHNRGWREGIAASVRAGVHAAPGAASRLLILTVDQWRVDAGDVRTLLRGARTRLPVAARYAGRVGVPAVFPRAWRARLLGLRGDAGAAALLRAAPVAGVAIEPAAIDLDTRTDLERLTTTRCRSRGRR
jgi:CTP:molybdopterin cytidylyltransferase MocA